MAAQAIADPEAAALPIPPTVSINRMADKMKAAMEKGSVEAAKAAETTKPAEKPKPPESPKQVETPKPVEVKAEVPEFKAPEKPVEKPAEKPSEKPTEKAKIPSENFKIVEKSRDEFKEKFEATQKQVIELEAKLKAQQPLISAEELEALRNEHVTYKTLAEKVALQETPEFKRAFTDKINQLRAEVKDAVGSENADKIAKILKLPADMRDEQIEAMAEELTSFKQANLIHAFTELRRVERERDAELAKTGENLSKLEEHRSNQDRQRTIKEQQDLESAFAVELQRASALPEFGLVEGNNEHNAFANANRQQAKALLSPPTPEAKARVAFWAAKGIASVQIDQMKDALISKLEKQIADMQGANPKVQSAGGAKQIHQTQQNKPKGFVEMMKQAMSEGIPEKE